MKDKSITIHGISPELNGKIQEKSYELHLSQNKTVKKILEDSLLGEERKRKNEFQDLCGIWSKEEVNEFEKLLEDFDKIDEEDWK